MTRETVIDFSKLPKSEADIDLTGYKTALSGQLEEEDLNKSEPESPEQKKKTKNELIEDEQDNDFDIPDFEVEVLDSEEEESSEQEEENPPKGKKTDKTSEEESEIDAEKQRKSRAQERIRELANQKKILLEEKLKAEEERKKYEEELIVLRKRAAESDDIASEQELNRAKQQYALAFQEGDPAKIADEMAKLQAITIRREMARAKKKQVEDLKVDEEVYKTRTEVLKKEIEESQAQDDGDDDEGSGTPLSQEGQNWLSRNKFLLADQNLFSTVAFMFDQVQEDGFDPNKPEAYAELEERLTGIYPGLEKLFGKKKTQKQEDTTTQPTKKKESVPHVASSSKTSSAASQNSSGGESYKIVNGKVKARPTKDDAEAARGMGIPLEAYMKQKIKREMAEKSGSKYTQIF